MSELHTPQASAARATQLWLSVLAVIIVVLGIVLLKPRPQTLPDAENLMAKGFSAEHYNTLKVDSFISLAQKAYGTLLKIERNKRTLIMRLENSNELAKDFFNGNDALLNENDHDFEIKFQPETQTVEAQFDIERQQQSVNVPNDVLIKMLEKSIAQQPTTKADEHE